MENCSSANLSMADWGHMTKLAGNQNEQKRYFTLQEPTATGVTGANNISRFKKLIDKLMENQSIPKGTGCDVSSTFPTTMLGCGSRTRRMDCKYWPGAPAFPEKY